MIQQDLQRFATILLDRGAGKKTRSDIYVHRSVAERACSFETQRLDDLWKAHTEGLELWNVVRTALDCSSISLLLYPDFYEVGHPTLRASLKIRDNWTHRTFTDFRNWANKPLLHRKELLIEETDSSFPLFRQLSAEEEYWSLFKRGEKIGYERDWEAVLKSAGVFVDGHRVVPITHTTRDGANRAT